jgi:hypothetical protein
MTRTVLAGRAAATSAIAGGVAPNGAVLLRALSRIASAAPGIDIDLSARMIHYHRLLKVVPAFLLLTAVATPAWSQGDDYEATFPHGFAKEGGYIGISGIPNFTLDGVTFDGETWYKEVDGEEIFILPRLNTRNMFRGIVGFRGRQMGLELSYDRTQHSGSFLEEPVDATFQAVNIDGKYFFLPEGRFQPHVVVGGAFPWLTIKDGSYLEPTLGDARYRGYGLNTEAGVTVYPHRRIGVGVGYNYRVLWFDRASGASDRLGELRPRFRETSGSFVFTGLVIF